jgi:glucosylceramidase
VNRKHFWSALVCGATLLAPTGSLSAADIVQAWVTTPDKSKLLARGSDPKVGTEGAGANRIDIDAERRYQEIVGFGAAVTDASAWLIQTKLNRRQRAALLQELFGRDRGGLGLSLTRISIGASDFSRSHYSLDDPPDGTPDPNLTHFSIEPHRGELLPVLRAALAINSRLRIIASPWSPPGWMKDSGRMIGGRLIESAQPAFARYLVRFVDAYAAEGMPLFALTLQNEPNFEPPDYPGMKLEPHERARIIGEFLGPMLAQRRAPPVILDWDHNWDHPESPLAVLADPQAAKFVAGVAWHCYEGDVAAQTPVHDAHPDKDAYLTECSGGEWEPRWEPSLRWFMRNLIIGSTRGWSRGVVLWNLALDEQHGPRAGGCADCRGVVTINSTTGMITRNVEYYVLAHASRFVRPGARRIDSTTGVDGLESVAFRNADDNSVVVIVLNDAQEQRQFSVHHQGRSFGYTLPAGAVATFTWKTKR